jgi:hypothetical protein
VRAMLDFDRATNTVGLRWRGLIVFGPFCTAHSLSSRDENAALGVFMIRSQFQHSDPQHQPPVSNERGWHSKGAVGVELVIAAGARQGFLSSVFPAKTLSTCSHYIAAKPDQHKSILLDGACDRGGGVRWCHVSSRGWHKPGSMPPQTGYALRRKSEARIRPRNCSGVALGRPQGRSETRASFVGALAIVVMEKPQVMAIGPSI